MKKIFLFYLLLTPLISYCQVPDDAPNLTRYWHFNSSGSVITDTDIIAGDIITFVGSAWTNGKWGYAFDSTSGGYGLTSGQDWGLADSSCATINFWIYYPNYPADENYYWNTNSNFGAYIFNVGLRLVNVSIPTDSGVVGGNMTGSVVMSSGVWQNIAVTFYRNIANGVKLYVDGNYVAHANSTQHNANWETTTSNVTMFAQTPSFTIPPAYWDNFCVFNTDLSQATIQNYMNPPLPPIPSAPAIVRDGTGTDIPSTTSTTELSANWDASSDSVTGYKFAVGTSAGATNIVDLTTLGDILSTTTCNLSLTIGTTYYFSVKAYNGAGDSSATNSDGQFVYEAPIISTNICYILILKREDLAESSLWDTGDVVLQKSEENFKGWGDTELDTNLFLTTKVTGNTCCYLGCLMNGTTIQKCREYQVYVASITSEMTCADFTNSLNKKTLE